MIAKEKPTRVAAGSRLRFQAWRELRPWAYLGVALYVIAYLIVWALVGFERILLVAIPILLVIAVVEFRRKLRQVRTTWISGAEAEEKVEERLKVLEKRGWHVLHGVLKPDGGDVDHIVWGPRGIFVIETKANRGKVGVEAGVLTFDGRMLERDPVDQVFRNSLFVKDHLKKALRHDYWIVSVVCLTDAFIHEYRLDIPERKVQVVKVERLIEFLQNYDDTRPLRPDQIKQVGEALNQIATAGAN